jgi:hypothetical protein
MLKNGQVIGSLSAALRLFFAKNKVQNYTVNPKLIHTDKYGMVWNGMKIGRVSMDN